MVIPVLPEYLTTLGGGEYKGLIIALFTLTALASRPFSGKLSDKIGRVPVIMFGGVVCIICSLIYPFTGTVAGLLWLRLFHGFSTGFTPTGQTAYLADIIPPERRGEGMGILGTASSVGMAGGMALGGVLDNFLGIDAVFYGSSLIALLAVAILFGIKETLPQKEPLRLSSLKINTSDLFEPRVIVPCIVMLLAAYAYGASITLIADFSEIVGVHNKGLLFTYLTLASLTVRLIGGKASDHWGRKPVLFASVSLIAVAMAVVASADTKTQLIIGVVLYGFAQGTTSPTLLAWATDLSNPLFKGRGLSSLYMAMELGIGVGAFVSGWLYGNEADNLFLTFMVSSVLAVMAVVYLVIERTSQKWTS